MKTIFKTFLLISTVLLSATFTYAKATDYSINIVSGSNSGLVQINLNDLAGNSSLTVTDENGVVLFDNNHVKKQEAFDFSKVNDGEYFIKIEDDKSIQTTLVSKKNNVVKLNENYEYVLKPLFKQEDNNKLNFYYVNVNRDKIKVDIYNNNRDLVYSYTTTDPVIQKKFDFSKSGYGNYNINVFTLNSSRDFSYNFDHE